MRLREIKMMNASNLSLTIAFILAATGCGDDHDHASHTSTGAETSSTDSSSQGSEASTDTTTDGSGTTTGATTHDSHTSTDATTHDSHDSHDSHTTADSDTTTGGSTTDDSTTDGYTPPSPADYCACMLDACHDLYHATWGEDHIESEQKCLAAAEATPAPRRRRARRLPVGLRPCGRRPRPARGHRRQRRRPELPDLP